MLVTIHINELISRNYHRYSSVLNVSQSNVSNKYLNQIILTHSGLFPLYLGVSINYGILPVEKRDQFGSNNQYSNYKISNTLDLLRGGLDYVWLG